MRLEVVWRCFDYSFILLTNIKKNNIYFIIFLN